MNMGEFHLMKNMRISKEPYTIATTEEGGGEISFKAFMKINESLFKTNSCD